MENIFKQNNYDVVVIIGTYDINIEEFIPQSNKVILVEASLAKYIENKGKYLEFTQVKNHNLLIGNSNLPVTYYEYSNSKVNNYKKPTGLNELFPRLKCIAEKSLSSVDVHSFIESLSLQTTNNLLVVNSLGNECDILERLDVTDFLKYFQSYIVKSSGIELYANAKRSNDIVKLFNKNHYNLIAEDASNDIDIPYFFFQRDTLLDELEKMQLTNEQFLLDTSKITELEHALINKQSELNHTSQELEIKVQEHSGLHEQVNILSDRLSVKEIDLNVADSKVTQLNEQLVLINEKHYTLQQEFAQKEEALLEQIERQKDALLDKNKIIAELKAKIGGLLVEQRNNKVVVAKLEKQVEESDEVSRLLNLEVKKAESQINMIKDFMFSSKQLG